MINKTENPIESKLGSYVTSTKTFIGSTKKIDQEGLFSEKIFGPEKSFACSCNNYASKIFHANKTCPKCGVLCASNEIRYSTFGKIKLAFPVINPIKHDKFIKLIKNINGSVVINPLRSWLAATMSHYLAFKFDCSELKLVKKLKAEPGYIVVPFCIKGIYSLHLVIKFLYEIIETPFPIIKEIMENNYFLYEIKVLPPQLRLVTFDQVREEYRTPEINKFYISLLNLNKNHSSAACNLYIDEPDWMGKIKITILAGIIDQDIVDPTVIQYDSYTASYQFWVDQIYKSVFDELSGKLGLIRNSILSKNIEFSARSVVIADTSLPPYQVKVSKKILEKLWMPYFLYWLINFNGIAPDKSYDDVVTIECFDPKYRELFDKFLIWFCDDLEYGQKINKRLARQAFLNRQPTLWRHGIGSIEIVPAEDDDDFTIGISPLMLESYNMDFDCH